MGLYRRKDSDVWWMSFTNEMENSIVKALKQMIEDLARRILKSIEGKIAEGKWFPETREKLADFTFRELAEKYKMWTEGRQKSTIWKGYVIKQLVKNLAEWHLMSSLRTCLKISRL